MGWVLLTAGAVSLPALLAPAAARAEPRPAGPAAGKRNEKEKQAILDQFRVMRMWKLTEELKLDEPTAAKVFPLLSKYDDLEREVGRERGRTMRELRQALDAPTPDAARIDAFVERGIALRARRQALEAEKIAALRRVLSPVQMGRLLLVAPRLEESFRQRIRDAIDGAREGDGLADPEVRRPRRKLLRAL